MHPAGQERVLLLSFCVKLRWINLCAFSLYQLKKDEKRNKREEILYESFDCE